MSRESKFLSLVLRHKPEEIDLQLDAHGWARVDELLRKLKKSGRKLSHDELIEIVETSDKKRFTLSEDGKRIRAAQGHSIEVDLGLKPQQPPSELYHGTASANLDAIFSNGLVPGKRQQVHLSLDPDTAERVGQRHGRPVVLRVEAQRMFDDGFEFFRADNGVWLTDAVPARYLGFGQMSEQ
ncbi:RNA 2'-phosphotransferase [Ruegeria marisrubri]|uniref:RNA 2'-phosphotransferase n=1 Tax=Ruegeria marisrubri TaxID=1685379 RepID=UPI001CD73A9F|nr:RNA 2'-phosphotransferase [Ruegeria marisrubri]MCA0907109.1 RNA 2'-phosphotransferase [Ruegeria marisrubri]